MLNCLRGAHRRKRSDHKAAHTSVEIQTFEPRMLLAGVVSALLTGTGASARLTITGDSADNQVALEVSSADSPRIAWLRAV